MNRGPAFTQESPPHCMAATRGTLPARRIALCLCALGLGVLAASPLQAGESVSSIMRKMVEKEKALASHRSIYSYTAESTREKLGEDGAVMDSSYAEVRIKGDPTRENGREKDEDLESGLKQASQEEPFNIINIIDHYDYMLVGSEVMEGVPCFKIAFTPKGDQPCRSREEKVANELRGFWWIAKADYSLVGNAGELTKPVSVAWFFATVRELEFSFRTRRLPNGELGPGRSEYQLVVQVMFQKIHERHIRVTKDYAVARNAIAPSMVSAGH